MVLSFRRNIPPGHEYRDWCMDDFLDKNGSADWTRETGDWS